MGGVLKNDSNEQTVHGRGDAVPPELRLNKCAGDRVFKNGDGDDNAAAGVRRRDGVEGRNERQSCEGGIRLVAMDDAVYKHSIRVAKAEHRLAFRHKQ